MRQVRQVSRIIRWLPGILALSAAFAAGCQGEVGGSDDGDTGTNGGGGTASTAGGNSGNAGTNAGTAGNNGTAGTTSGATAGTNGGGIGGTNGTSGGGDDMPCEGAGDARLVPAPQRILRLTLQEIVNSVKTLVDSTEATNLVTSGNFGNIGAETDLAFPPLDANREGVNIDDAKFQTGDAMNQDIWKYVSTNFATLTKCSGTATDQCATTYLNALAAKAYRRPLQAAEQTRLTNLYNSLKSSTVNGWLVTNSVQEATSAAAYAILSTPQFLYRSELGDTSKASTSPPGVPLTQYELASALSFFLTDSPPDQTLLDQAAAGTLSNNIVAQTNRLLGVQSSKDWVGLVMYTFYGLNFLFNSPIDPGKFPEFNTQLLNDERTEAQKFLANVLWNGNLTDVLLSNTTFINSNLATTIYKVPVPAGATATNFVQTTLPADQRTGLLTNAAFFATNARSDRASVVPRGKNIRRTVTCVPSPGPPPDLSAVVAAAMMNLATETAQQEVQVRNSNVVCAGCHSHFDPFGLSLDGYDDLGRVRTVNEVGQPVDPSTTLPPEIGGVKINNVIDLAHQFTQGDVFTNCMAQTVLQYALTDIYSAPVPLPSLPNTSPFRAGCAVDDVTTRYKSAQTKTFSDMVRAAVASPAFALRYVPQQ